MSTPSHLAAFSAGAVVATAVAVAAAPSAVTRRYQTLDTFAQALTLIGAEYVEPVDDVGLLRDAMRGMAGGLDAHSTYLAPSQYRQLRQDTDGEFGGIGVTFGPGDLLPGEVPGPREVAAGEPVVEDVIIGSPADTAGLRVGDRLVAVDGAFTSMAGRAVEDATRWESALRGPSGTRVVLAIRRVGWREPRDLTLVRAQVKVPSVSSLAVGGGLGYVAIARMQEATAADVDDALDRLATAGALDALILDLRGDPGGLVDAGVAVADRFVGAGTIVTMRSRDGTVERHVAHAAGTRAGFPMVCLVDEGTASAAEIVTAALREHERCTVVGMPTYGKGSVQTFFDLDDGGGLKLTTARYLTPRGNSLEGRGITPDLEVEAFAPELITGDGTGAGDELTVPGAPTQTDLGSPGEPPGPDARIRARLADDPQFDAAVAHLRKLLGPGPGRSRPPT
ncbi:MAG: S41 family peptidase [Kofleriaceae bacterium]